jgi:hypothetical protein
VAQPPHPYGSPPPAGDDSSTGDVAREQGEQVKDEAVQQAQAVAGTAAGEASHVAQEAAGHARDLAADAKRQLHRQAREQTEHLGGALGQLGDRVHALAEGRREEAGPVGDYVERIADQVDELAGRVDGLGFDGLIDEVQRFARRRPGAFLAGAAITGFAVSRLGRGVQAAQDEEAGSGGQGGAPAPGASSGSPTTGGFPPAAPSLPDGPAPAGPPPMPATPATGTSPTGTTTPPADPIAPPRDPAVRPDPLSSEQVRR